MYYNIIMSIDVLTGTYLDRAQHKKDIEYEFLGQKCTYSPIKNKLTFTIKKPFSDSTVAYIPSVGVNQDIINYVLGRNCILNIYVMELKTNYSITPQEIGDYKKTHENVWLVNGVFLNIFPLNIMTEITNKL